MILVICLAGSPGLTLEQENSFNLKMDRRVSGNNFLNKPMNQSQENNPFQEGLEPWQHKRLSLDGLSLSKITDDIEHLRQLLANRTASKMWSTELKEVLLSHSTFWLTFFILLGVTLLLLNRVRFHLIAVLGKIEQGRFPIRHCSVFIMQHSILLAGATLFVYLYLLVSPSAQVFGVLRFFTSILMVVLFTRWARYFARNWLLEQHWIKDSDTARLSVVLTGVRYGAIFYISLVGLTGVGSTLPTVLSVFIEFFLLIGAIYFWRNFQKGRTTLTGKPTRRQTTVLSLCKMFSYGIIGGGIVMNLLGYGSFSIYWYVSWGMNFVILLWGGLFFLFLREWRQELKAQTLDGALYEDTANQPFKWFVFQLSWLIGLAVILVLLIFAWGGRQAVIINMVSVLNYPINIGKINFSIINVIYAVVVLVFTHALARFWRFVLKEKILSESGLNTGLQDSITMISVYAVWAFGIMLSLHTFGMGTTTLAFAFGALGIGLGFGLQNIFNNFISGIILLFERPIQVGDDIEINGIWATVKKINVRATVVQTFDNASIIIPNSEFISSQVTNWSFNDKHLRRSIDVGVAYGSDIEGVRKTLLEIADKTPKVFKQPKPDVVFRDFGDSALMFRLRVWTDIDNIFKIETAIRFEIDKRFREKGFVIAFPQRDVHLFTDGSPQVSDAAGRGEPRK